MRHVDTSSDALIDSERAISLDERNILGHFQKA
jgi:hypothetical protein